MGIRCILTSLKFVHGDEYYGCFIQGVQAPENKKLDIFRLHRNGYTDFDVLHIKFLNCTMMKVPRELTAIFPNLRHLVICNSKLKKISKNDLIEYKNLEVISMMDNELEFLPGDLFEDFQNLNYVNFKGNKLNLIEPNILDGLRTIRYVDFSSNTNYEKCFSIYPVHEPNATLEEVKDELFDKFYSRYDFLVELRRSETRLKQETQQLKNSKILLEGEILQFKLSEEKLKQENQRLKIKIEEKSKNELVNEILKKSQPVRFSTSLTDDFNNYIQDENSKDFKIKVDDHEFLVHKFLLIVRSPTLCEILKNNPEVGNLNLVDIPVEIFEVILKFFYTDKLPCDNETNFLQLLAAAGKLKIYKLINYAAEKLLYQVNPENALEILSLSDKFQFAELKRKAFQEVKKKYSEIEFKDEWLENSEKLKNIVEMFREKEEARRKFEEKFKKIMTMD